MASLRSDGRAQGRPVLQAHESPGITRGDLVAQTAVAAARLQVETYPASRGVYHAPRLVAFARISPKRGA